MATSLMLVFLWRTLNKGGCLLSFLYLSNPAGRWLVLRCLSSLSQLHSTGGGMVLFRTVSLSVRRAHTAQAAVIPSHIWLDNTCGLTLLHIRTSSIQVYYFCWQWTQKDIRARIICSPIKMFFEKDYIERLQSQDRIAREKKCKKKVFFHDWFKNRIEVATSTSTLHSK